MPRSRPALGILLALAATGVLRAEPGTFRIDAAGTSARFAVEYLGVATARGRFARMSGAIVVAADQKVDRIDLVIDTQSVDMGWDLRDAFVRSEVMFDVQRFPQLRFRSTRTIYDGTRLVALDGEVTLHGVTRPVRLAVAQVECAPRREDDREVCAAVVTGRLSRRAFGMGFAYPLIGDDVELDFAVTAVRDPGAGAAGTP